MKFRCERDILVDALTTASRAVSSRGASLPILNGLRLTLRGDELELTGSDLDLTISTKVVVSGVSDGQMVIPAKLATDIVKALPAGAVEIDAESDTASIGCGRSEFSVHLMPAAEFPHVNQLNGSDDGVRSIVLQSAQFLDGLKQVTPAASHDESRPVLTGVLLASEGTGLRLAATDSYRLSVRDLPGSSVLDEGQSVLVPSRAFSELTRIAPADEISLLLGTKDATFDCGNVRLTTRLIEGDFPNYRGLIPSHQPNRLTIDRAALIEAVRRVRLMAREATPVRLTMNEDSLELVAISQDVGQAHERLDAQFTGDDLTVAFNPEYLLQGLEVTPGDEVSLETVDSLKPALLRSTESSEFLYLLMPVRVS